MDDSKQAEFVFTKFARLALGVSETTLRRMARNNIIRCVRKNTRGSHRYYDVTEYITRHENLPRNTNKLSKKSICYCRVSSRGQLDDLQRQIEYMRTRCPNHEIIKDVGSVLNFSRKGFKTVLELAIAGLVDEVVVAHKDRLCRFGFELVEHIVGKYSRTQIVVLNDETRGAEAELANDILQVLTVFAAKANGRRKYSNKSNTSSSVPRQRPT